MSRLERNVLSTPSIPEGCDWAELGRRVRVAADESFAWAIVPVAHRVESDEPARDIAEEAKRT